MGGMSQPPQPYPPAGEIEPSSDDRTWAAVAHFGAFAAAYVALGLLAPLVVLLIRGSASPFVRRHSVESLNFQITVLIWVAVGVAVSIATLGVGLLVVIPIGVVIAIVYLVAVIVGGVRALNGEDFRYPLTLRFVS